jgi:3-hydroxyacyl-CoA dehydrogenase
MAVFMRRAGTVGYVELDNPPVNAMSLAVRAGLLEAVNWAERERLERVIVSGRGRIFAAGGDAREFDLPPAEPHLPDVLNRIERSDVPWIAAVNGAALGGGLELMLACRYRVAAPGSQLGLPEVTLGVVPGAGGTQRLPRLVGMEKALDLIPTGRSISAEQARAIGLIDEIDADPVYFAEMTNPEWLGMKVPVGELNSGAVAPELFQAARKAATSKMRGQAAPLRAIDLLEAAQRLPLDEGLAVERAAFVDLRGSAQAKALRHVFFAERSARVPDWLKATDVADPGEIAVVGGGTMGAGIAYALISGGYRVVVLETDAEAVARARSNVDRLFEAALRRGLLSEETAARRRQSLVISSDYAAASRAELAIEAAFESMDVKKTVLSALQAALPTKAVLATNTSYLDIDVMAVELDDPSRLVGLHFFAPAHIMKLLEIVRGAKTSDRALALGFELARKLRKVPVLAGVCDGFIGNRILARYREAADTVLIDGSTPWEIDEAMVEFGYAMGPYEAQDLSGLDIAFANRRRQDATRDPRRRYIPVADRMVELGKLGKKTGAGWYRYPGGGGKVDDPIVADLAIEEAHFAKIKRRDFTAEEIRRRLLLAMINEAADILAEGIASSATDIDLVTVFGYGFPRWRGGLMHYADTLGPTNILAELEDLAKEDPVAWRPSRMIADCVTKGMSFASWRI